MASPAVGIAGSNPAVEHGCFSCVSVVCCQVVFSATGRSLIQRSPNEYGVPVCDLETSTMRRPRPERGCCTTKRNHPERDGSHSPPSSTEAKNKRSYTSVPPICLHGVDSDLTMYFFVNEYIHFVRKSKDFDPALVSEDHMWSVELEMNAFIKSYRFKDFRLV